MVEEQPGGQAQVETDRSCEDAACTITAGFHFLCHYGSRVLLPGGDSYDDNEQCEDDTAGY